MSEECVRCCLAMCNFVAEEHRSVRPVRRKCCLAVRSWQSGLLTDIDTKTVLHSQSLPTGVRRKCLIDPMCMCLHNARPRASTHATGHSVPARLDAG